MPHRMIGLVPPTLTWPSPIVEGPFRELARANLTTVVDVGICLTNLNKLKPDDEAIEDYTSLLGTLQSFAHLVGGDMCAHLYVGVDDVVGGTRDVTFTTVDTAVLLNILL